MTSRQKWRLGKELEKESKKFENSAMSNPKSTVKELCNLVEDSGLDKKTIEDFKKLVNVKKAFFTEAHETLIVAAEDTVNQKTKQWLYNNGKGLTNENFYFDKNKCLFKQNKGNGKETIVLPNAINTYNRIRDGYNKANNIINLSKYFYVNSDNYVNVVDDKFKQDFCKYLIDEEANELCARFENYANESEVKEKYFKDVWIARICKKIEEWASPVTDFIKAHPWMTAIVALAAVASLKNLLNMSFPDMNPEYVETLVDTAKNIFNAGTTLTATVLLAKLKGGTTA